LNRKNWIDTRNEKSSNIAAGKSDVKEVDGRRRREALNKTNESSKFRISADVSPLILLAWEVFDVFAHMNWS